MDKAKEFQEFLGEVKTEEVKEPTVEVMERATKKVCCELSKDVKCACQCCLRTWSFSLNTCEGCCTISSATCVFLSTIAIGIRDCLEQLDCDSK